MKQIAYFTLFLFFLAVNSQNPGIKVAVTHDFFVQFQKSILPQLVAKIGNIEVASIQSGGLTLSNLVVSEISLPAESLRLSFNDDHLSVASDSFGLRIDLNAAYDLYLFSIGFNMVITCSNSSFLTDFGFAYAQKNIALKMNEFILQINNLDLYFPAWLTDKIIGSIVRLFLGSIQDMLSDNLSKALGGVVEESVNKIIDTMPGYTPIPGTIAGVDYNPNQSPKISANYFSVNLNGTFYNADTGLFVPPVPLPAMIPDYDETTGGSTQVFISDYMINTALYTFWQAGLLKTRVTQDLIPAQAPLNLNIQWLQVFIPEVAKYYSPSVQVAFDVEVSEFPLAAITPHDVEAKLTSIVTIYAVQDGKFTKIASLEGAVDIHANASVSNWKVSPFVSNATFFNYSVIHSDVGSIDAGLFEQGMNLMMGLVIPALNAQSIVVDLPTLPYIDLATLKVSCFPGYLEITATPTFKIPSEDKINFIFDSAYQYNPKALEFLKLDD
eukprot:CAMPEP_0176417248 /NCGR_PEP_ID=MMETSP0127-20121128/6786_1 /TAXON_ID=938130 /ORGANISM="Platyophrya macrostoma, Strain WH" /LENGTH=496 /DNA_ID=CAMNT_0017797393 /DNA_START=3 /DNA_END=1493 /DNA_ORIENTATION=+